MEIGWVKGKGQGKSKGNEKGKGKRQEQRKGQRKTQEREVRGMVTTADNGVAKLQNCWHGKEKPVHQMQGTAGTASSSSSQCTLSATDVGTKEIGHGDSVCEDAEMSWIFMVADAVAINQLSMDGAHSLVVDSGVCVHVCPKKRMPLTRRLQALSDMLARF